MSGTHLVVFARAPIVGTVKTRLFRDPGAALEAGIREVSAEEATALHVAFLEDVCQKGVRSGLSPRRLYISGDPRHAAFQQAVQRHGFTLREQSGGDLGSRMDAAIAGELLEGAGAVVLIGTDSPTLPAAFLQQAARWLDSGDADVVLGPALDGGFYLIGARRQCPELLSDKSRGGISWSTNNVLAESLERLHRLQANGWRVRLLPFWYDVDTPHDLRLLSSHLQIAHGATAGTELLTSIWAPRTWALLNEFGFAAVLDSKS